jgi:dATP pyrophosphohydrolase
MFKIPISILVVIHSPELEVLLLERADRPGFWQSVTGSLDAPDEMSARAALREVREETGISPGVTPGVPLSALRDLHTQIEFEIFGHWRHRYAPGITHNTEHWFALEVSREVAVCLHDREHLQHVWLPWREAAQRCFSWSNREAIELVAAGRSGAPS